MVSTFLSPARWAVFLITAFIYLPAFAQTADAPPDYVERIEAHRDSVDADLRDPDMSVLSDEDRAAFDGLAYFDIDPAYRVEATFEPDGDPTRRPLSTTMGGTRPHETAGVLSFRLNGSEHELTVYRSVNVETDTLTVPFTDATTGESTYSAGRYLFITEQDIQSNPVVVDFNKATNPACAYNARYNCVIPPEKNVLDTPIQAGVQANTEVGTPYDRDKMIKDIESMADAEWVTVDIEEDYYEISFPETPEDTSWEEATPRGLILLSMRALDSGQASFFSNRITFPFSPERVGLNRAQLLDGMVKNLSEDKPSPQIEDFTFQGYPAKRVRFTNESGDVEVLWRFYGVGSDIYQTSVEMPIYGDPAAAERFLDSFSFTIPPDSIEAITQSRLAAADSAASSAVPSDSAATVGPSPEVNAMLDEIGWRDYDVDENGRYAITLRVGDERTQLGRIMVIPEDTPDRPVAGYEIYSAVTQTDEPLAPEFMRDLLLANGPGYGSFELYELEDDSQFVAYTVFVSKPLTAASLQSIFSHVLLSADEMEEKHIGGDEY